MLKPHLLWVLICAVFLCVSYQSVYPSVKIFFQSQTSSTPDRAGIELYEKGDDLAAIKALKAAVKQNKADLRAWHYLGLAFERQRKTGDARKAHEKAAKLGDALLEARFVGLSATEQKALFQEIREPLSQAAESVKRYIALNPSLSKSKREDWNEREEYLRNFAEFSDLNKSQGQSQIFSGREVTTKARVLTKPEPKYTAEARKHQITGTVRLRAIFSANGNVTGIFPIIGLPYGLTRQAVKAARQIRFDPATKDGKPVSMFIQLEYNFNLY
jgi:TonB family protein